MGLGRSKGTTVDIAFTEANLVGALSGTSQKPVTHKMTELRMISASSNGFIRV